MHFDWEKFNREWEELTKAWKTYTFQASFRDTIKAPDEAEARQALAQAIKDDATGIALEALVSIAE